MNEIEPSYTESPILQYKVHLTALTLTVTPTPTPTLARPIGCSPQPQA